MTVHERLLDVRHSRRLAVILSVTLVALLLGGTPAWAHSRLLHTSPGDGAVDTVLTTSVVLTFNEMVKQRFTTVVVQGAEGMSYSRGSVRVVDENVTQEVYPLPSGAYHVAWRAISADGHPVQGEFRFTVALPAGAEPTVRPPATVAAAVPSGKRHRGWLIVGGLIVVAVVVLVTIVGVAVWGRKRRARVEL